MTTKRFPVRVILTSTTGRLLTEPKENRDNGIGDLHDLLEWMTGEAPFTHSLPRFNDECAPFLLEQFPELASVVEEDLQLLDKMMEENLKEGQNSAVEAAWRQFGLERWLVYIVNHRKLKDYYDVSKLPNGLHANKNPFVELARLMNKGGA